MSRRTIRRLGDGDRSELLDLTARHVFDGALLEYLVALLGVTGEFACYGLYEAYEATAGRADHSECKDRLTGALTYDAAGRSTVLGAGAEWAPKMATHYRNKARQGQPLAFIDAPAELAEPLADLLPPVSTEQLGIWAWSEAAAREPGARQTARNTTPGNAGGVRDSTWLVRRAQSQDALNLQGLYDTLPDWRAVSAADWLEATGAGQRLLIVGLLGESIVCAAAASLVERYASRVSGVYAHPSHRPRGYGAAVVSKLTDELVAAGRRPFLYVSMANPPAMSIYQRLGYQPHRLIVKLRYQDC